MLHNNFWMAARMGCLLAATVMALACNGSAAARKETDETRKAALVQLQSPAAAARLAACTVLAEIGMQDDVPMLQSHLYDEDERVRGAAEAAMWAIWSRSGDAAADRLFERGVGQMREGSLSMAVETFSRLIAMRPEFAEAWNKRATLYFLLGQDDLSLKDCDEVLKRNPSHFGVLAGYGQLYLRKGDLPRSLEYFERALAINPNMAGVEASIEALKEILIKRGHRFI